RPHDLRAVTATQVVHVGGDPGERSIPIDGDLVGGPGLDVVDVAHRRGAAGELLLRHLVLEPDVGAAGDRARRRVGQVGVELVGPEPVVLVVRVPLAVAGDVGLVERVAAQQVV